MKQHTLIGIPELAELIGRRESTVRADVTRRPHTLPPRTKLPGSNRVLWHPEDVIAWLEKCRPAPTSN